jgi:hypothetical protein
MVPAAVRLVVGAGVQRAPARNEQQGATLQGVLAESSGRILSSSPGEVRDEEVMMPMTSRIPGQLTTTSRHRRHRAQGRDRMPERANSSGWRASPAPVQRAAEAGARNSPVGRPGRRRRTTPSARGSARRLQSDPQGTTGRSGRVVARQGAHDPSQEPLRVSFERGLGDTEPGVGLAVARPEPLNVVSTSVRRAARSTRSGRPCQDQVGAEQRRVPGQWGAPVVADDDGSSRPGR